MAGLSLAGEKAGAGDGAPLVLSLRDAKKGTFDVFSGGSKVTLTDKDLGTFLAKLSDLAKGGDYRTTLLPVQADGTLSAQTSESVVEPILGGTAKSPEQGSAVRVSLRNATGSEDSTEQARVTLLNGGFTVLEGGTADALATSQVIYADAADEENAAEVAKTLGLPDGSVTKGTTGSGADVLVVLGQDYKPASDG